MVILAFILLALGHANFECAPLFLGKVCVPRNILNDQNCLGTMTNNTSAIYLFSILVIHANIAKIRKLANTTIYGLKSANYFGFQIP